MRGHGLSPPLSTAFPQFMHGVIHGVFVTLQANKYIAMRKLTVEDLNRIDVDTFKQAPKVPLVMVLDNIRSVHNVGSVLRTADAMRIEAVYMCGITATPPSAEMHKTALGAEDSVAWRYYNDTLQAVSELKAAGYVVLAVEQVEGSLKLGAFKFDPSKRYALVMGNEVKGVRQDVVDACDQALEIPQYGTKHSMNVSVTAGIVMWEAASAFR